MMFYQQPSPEKSDVTLKRHIPDILTISETSNKDSDSSGAQKYRLNVQNQSPAVTTIVQNIYKVGKPASCLTCPKSIENASSEFQSLKLESLSTMEEFKAVSETFSSILAKEIPVTKKYAEIGSPVGGSESKSILSSSDEDTDSSQSVFKQQVKYFHQMKQFLMTQQTALQQNLDTLNRKAAKKNEIPKKSCRKDGSLEKISSKQTDGNSDIVSQPTELEVLKQWGSSSTKKRTDNMQICPLCGLEFENSESSEVLEEHVAGHWCSADQL